VTSDRDALPTQSDSTEPNATESDLTASDVSEPDSTESDATVPDPTAEPAPTLPPGSIVPEVATRPRRRALLTALVGLLVLGLVVGGGVWWWTSRPAPPPPAAAQVATPHTLFVGVARSDNTLSSGMLLATTPEVSSALLVPGDLMVDVPTAGTTSLSAALPLGSDLPGAALSDALGVRVDGQWVVPMDGLVGLIDAVGGITVDVDTPVEANGLQIGVGAAQKLNGVQALTFGGWTASGESPSKQLMRMAQVTSVTLGALPADPAQVAAMLGTIPGTTTLSGESLATELVAFGNHVRGKSLQVSLLPTLSAPVPNNPNAVTVDQATAQTLIGLGFAGTELFVPGAAGSLRLQNASGVAGLESVARRRLVDAEFTYVWGGLAEPVQPRTVVMIRAESARQTGNEVAAALGLGEDSVMLGTNVVVGTDCLVLLGQDFAAVAAAAAPSASSSPAPAQTTTPPEASPTAAEPSGNASDTP
jgi:hypothetical protein